MTWRVAWSLDKALEQLNALAPNRSRASDGSVGDAAHALRDSRHNPDQYGIVRARDFTHDPAHGADMNLFPWALMADPRAKEVIWNDEYYDRDPTGRIRKRPYLQVNPARTNKHDHHLHLGVVSDNRADATHSWGAFTPTKAQEDDDMPTLVRRRSDGAAILVIEGIAVPVQADTDMAELRDIEKVKMLDVSDSMFGDIWNQIRSRLA